MEHLRLLCSLAAGRAEATLAVLHNTPFTDVNDAEGEVQVAGYAAFEAGSRALRLLAGFIRAARVDEARVRRHIDESCITATELADSLVRAEGISFRQAHEVVSRLVRGMLEPRRAVSHRSLRGRSPRRSPRWRGARPGSGRPTFAGTRRPSTSSPCARSPAARRPGRSARALPATVASSTPPAPGSTSYRARLESVDRRLAERARALTGE